MLIYFDESYDGGHDYLLLGALFNPHSQYLHREILRIKKAKNFVTKTGELQEIKYNRCLDLDYYKLCEECINSFIKSTSWFRCIVIEEAKLDLNFFGKPNEPTKMKRARAYKKFAEMLLSFNTRNIKNGVLLVDDLSRCYGDRFIEVMKQEFSAPGQKYSRDQSLPTLKEILPVKSEKVQYQVVQVADLLIGCVLNHLKPTKNKYKNKIRGYLIKKLEIPSLLPDFWGKFRKQDFEVSFPKFNVWYWGPRK